MTHSYPKQPPLKIAINGFGRIGRNVLRALLERQLLSTDDVSCPLELVAINDLADANTKLHLLKFDSTHGRLSQQGIHASLSKTGNLHLQKLDKQHRQFNHAHGIVNIIDIPLLQHASPKELPWQQLGVDVVLECTGQFRSYADANLHRQAGATQVIVGAAPFDDVDASVVMGINEMILTRQLPIISSVSCTTQALVPLIDTLHQAYGVTAVMMTEIHALTADQNVLDQAHRDLRRARASGFNIIPTTSSSLAATERVLPYMVGKINGHSIRVPTIDVAAIDVTFQLAQISTPDKINQTLKSASLDKLSGIMGYSDAPLVSSDFFHQPQSLIVDALQTMQVGDMIKVFAWYDNEWGYANRLVDMCVYLASLSH